MTTGSRRFSKSPFHADDSPLPQSWQAKKSFLAALEICPRDTPSSRIMMHMDTPEQQPDYGLATAPFVAPDGWPGYHILLSK
jgi:hypothetical protein